MPAIKEVNLADVADADQGERRVNLNVGAGFFARFAPCRLVRGFAIFQEAGVERPIAYARLDGTAAKKDFVFPGANAPDHQARVFLMDVGAAAADGTQAVVIGRDGVGDRSGALGAELDYGNSKNAVRASV